MDNERQSERFNPITGVGVPAPLARTNTSAIFGCSPGAIEYIFIPPSASTRPTKPNTTSSSSSSEKRRSLSRESLRRSYIEDKPNLNESSSSISDRSEGGNDGERLRRNSGAYSGKHLSRSTSSKLASSAPKPCVMKRAHSFTRGTSNNPTRDTADVDMETEHNNPPRKPGPSPTSKIPRARAQSSRIPQKPSAGNAGAVAKRTSTEARASGIPTKASPRTMKETREQVSPASKPSQASGIPVKSPGLKHNLSASRIPQKPKTNIQEAKATMHAGAEVGISRERTWDELRSRKHHDVTTKSKLPRRSSLPRNSNSKIAQYRSQKPEECDLGKNKQASSPQYLESRPYHVDIPAPKSPQARTSPRATGNSLKIFSRSDSGYGDTDSVSSREDGLMDPGHEFTFSRENSKSKIPIRRARPRNTEGVPDGAEIKSAAKDHESLTTDTSNVNKQQSSDAPALTTPAVTTAAVTSPAVTTPAVTAQAVTTPAVTAPALTTPAVYRAEKHVGKEKSSVRKTEREIELHMNNDLTSKQQRSNKNVNSSVNKPQLARKVSPSHDDHVAIDTRDLANNAPIKSEETVDDKRGKTEHNDIPERTDVISDATTSKEEKETSNEGTETRQPRHKGEEKVKTTTCVSRSPEKRKGVTKEEKNTGKTESETSSKKQKEMENVEKRKLVKTNSNDSKQMKEYSGKKTMSKIAPTTAAKSDNTDKLPINNSVKNDSNTYETPPKQEILKQKQENNSSSNNKSLDETGDDQNEKVNAAMVRNHDDIKLPDSVFNEEMGILNSELAKRVLNCFECRLEENDKNSDKASEGDGDDVTSNVRRYPTFISPRKSLVLCKRHESSKDDEDGVDIPLSTDNAEETDGQVLGIGDKNQANGLSLRNELSKDSKQHPAGTEPDKKAQKSAVLNGNHSPLLALSRDKKFAYGDTLSQDKIAGNIKAAMSLEWDDTGTELTPPDFSDDELQTGVDIKDNGGDRRPSVKLMNTNEALDKLKMIQCLIMKEAESRSRKESLEERGEKNTSSLRGTKGEMKSSKAESGDDTVKSKVQTSFSLERKRKNEFKIERNNISREISPSCENKTISPTIWDKITDSSISQDQTTELLNETLAKLKASPQLGNSSLNRRTPSSRSLPGSRQASKERLLSDTERPVYVYTSSWMNASGKNSRGSSLSLCSANRSLTSSRQNLAKESFSALKRSESASEQIGSDKRPDTKYRLSNFDELTSEDGSQGVKRHTGNDFISPMSEQPVIHHNIQLRKPKKRAKSKKQSRNTSTTLNHTPPYGVSLEDLNDGKTKCQCGGKNCVIS